MPPMKIYETLQQANPDTSQQFQGGSGGGADLDFFKQDKDDQSKKEEASNLG